jgi:Lar family restriction alleviation protein
VSDNAWWDDLMVRKHGPVATDVKPYPFCGGPPIQGNSSGEYRGKDAVQVMCDRCGSSGPFRLTQRAAAEAWNRRVKNDSRVVTRHPKEPKA